MNKSRLFAIVIASLASTTAAASAQAVKAGAPRAAHAGKPAHALLRGLQLTAEQKAKAKEVHQRYAPEAKSLRESMRPAMQEARSARQKGDTASARAIFQRTESTREKLRTLSLRQSSEVRAILSPSQQQQFDANVQLARQKHGKGKMGRGKSRKTPTNGSPR